VIVDIVVFRSARRSLGEGGRSLLFLALSLLSAHAGEYYVSTQGNDSSPGTSAQPFRTITRAYRQATAGTTIIVMPGVYTDYSSEWGLHLGGSGTAANPIILKSQFRGGAIIDGQNAGDRNVGIYIDGSYNIVDGFEIRGGPHGGITIWGDFNQILNNNIHHNGNPASSSTLGQDGVYSSENTRNTVYVGNYIHDNGRAGSNLDHALYLCGDNEMIINNVLVRNAAYGLHIAGYDTVSNMKVYNNVMAYNGKSGIILWMPVSGVDIRNNIIVHNGKFGIDSYDAHGNGVVIDRNLVFGNGLGDYGFAQDFGSDFTYTMGTTISSAPNFVNSTAGGFDAHLGDGSPAIGAAGNLSSMFNTDLDGAARPASGAWDLGAYKYGNTGTTPPTATVSVTASDPTAVIGTSDTGSFTFTRTGDTSAPLTVSYSLGGSAIKWNDYRRPEGDMPTSVTIPAGAISYTMTIVAVANVTQANPPTVSLTLLPDAAYTVGGSGNSTITLVGNAPVVSLRKISGNNMQITWTSMPGKVYRVICKHDFTAPNWTEVSGNITATTTTTSWTDTTSAASKQGYYSVYMTN
jgi:hypothetical protein